MALLNIIKSWVSTCLVRSHNPAQEMQALPTLGKDSTVQIACNVAASGVYSHFGAEKKVKFSPTVNRRERVRP